jgi:biotin synthase
MYDQLLEIAENGETTEAIALQLLEGAKETQNALKLFALASKIRDENLGTDLYWTSGISRVIPCKITPRCRYCTFYARKEFPPEKLAKTAKKLEELGLKQLHLSGGSNLQGYDKEIIEMVKAIRAVSDINIEVNLGCSFSLETVRKLKSMNMLSITSSLETINEEVFTKAKPGDSLDMKKQLMENCEREGVPIRSMMLIGMGESAEDQIHHLFYMKQFTQLTHLNFSRFMPYPDTEYKDHPRCSPWQVARVVAVARLLMPAVHLGLAAGNTTDDIPLWLMAGGGNQVGAAHVSRVPVVPGPEEQIIEVDEDIFIKNRMPVVQRYLENMGRNVIFERPPHQNMMEPAE